MEIHYNGNLRIFLFAIFGILMMSLSFLIYVYDPKEILSDKLSQLTENSLTFRLWENPTYEIYFKVYIFNCTNGEEFIRGEEKLKFQEVGPYTFQEILQNTNVQFNDNSTLSYSPKRSLKFLRHLSVGDPHNDFIYSPNIPLLGIASMLHKSSIFLNMAVRSITNYLDSKAILNMTVHEYLWGYEDSLVEMASKILPNWIDFKQFGILDRMMDEGNNTINMVIEPDKVPGSSLIDEEERGRLYSIMSWNGSPGLAQWGYKMPEEDGEIPESNTKCNMLQGAYDGTIFPKNISRDSVFRLYRKPFCRTVPIEFDHSSMSDDGFEGYHYKVVSNFLDRYEDNPDNECYCVDKEFCLPSGFGDITPCYYGFPTAVSLPHFLNVDPSVYTKIEGMAPEYEKHGTSIVINPKMGLLLQGYSRMQINLVMRQTKYNAKAAPFNNMIIPLFWSEMSVDKLPANVAFLLTLLYKVLPVVQLVIMYLLAIGGASFIATAGILVVFTAGPVIQRTPSLGLGYTTIRMIPVIRRESLLSDIRDKDR